MPWPRRSLAETTSAHSQRGRDQAQQKTNLAKAHMLEAECEGNPAQWKWQEAQCAGNWDRKNKLGQKLTRFSLKFQKTSSLGRRSSPLWLDGHMANRILIPLQSLVSYFLKHPVNRWMAMGATEGLWQGLLPSVSWRLHYLLCPRSCCPSGWGFFGP